MSFGQKPPGIFRTLNISYFDRWNRWNQNKTQQSQKKSTDGKWSSELKGTILQNRRMNLIILHLSGFPWKKGDSFRVLRWWKFYGQHVPDVQRRNLWFTWPKTTSHELCVEHYFDNLACFDFKKKHVRGLYQLSNERCQEMCVCRSFFWPCCLRHVHDACRLMVLPRLPFCFPSTYRIWISKCKNTTHSNVVILGNNISPQTRPCLLSPSMKNWFTIHFGDVMISAVSNDFFSPSNVSSMGRSNGTCKDFAEGRLWWKWPGKTHNP